MFFTSPLLDTSIFTLPSSTYPATLSSTVITTLAVGTYTPSISFTSKLAFLIQSKSTTPYFPPDHFKYFFGDSAIQNAGSIIIQKSDLTGLNPSISNTAESLFVGIINRILSNRNLVEFPEITLKYWGFGVINGKRVDTVIIDLRNKITAINGYDLPDTMTIINPNNY